MNFLSSLNADELHRFHTAVSASTQVRNHFDILSWLQGDLQRYVPHDALIVSWGDFKQGELKHDVLSRLPGVRSNDADTRPISPLMRKLHLRWTEFGCKPFSLNASETGFLLDNNPLQNALGEALKHMGSAIIHGVVDRRGHSDCLYAGFSAKAIYSAQQRSAVSVVLPYIDTALRQVALLPHQRRQRRSDTEERRNSGPASSPPAADSLSEVFNLTYRESEVLHWVAKGKTNPEIAMILEISSFTVKNHMQRVFRKLDVSNRAQAVSKYRPSAAGHVQV